MWRFQNSSKWYGVYLSYSFTNDFHSGWDLSLITQVPVSTIERYTAIRWWIGPSPSKKGRLFTAITIVEIFQDNYSVTHTHLELFLEPLWIQFTNDNSSSNIIDDNY